MRLKDGSRNLLTVDFGARSAIDDRCAIWRTRDNSRNYYRSVHRSFSAVFRPRRIRTRATRILRSNTCLQRDAKTESVNNNFRPASLLLPPRVKRISWPTFRISVLPARERTFLASCILHLREVDSTRARSRCSVNRTFSSDRTRDVPASASGVNKKSLIRASAISPTDPQLLVTDSLFLPDAWPRYRRVLATSLNSGKQARIPHGAFHRERLYANVS